MLRDIFRENQNFPTEPALSLKFVTHINAFICMHQGTKKILSFILILRENKIAKNTNYRNKGNKIICLIYFYLIAFCHKRNDRISSVT